MDIRFVTEGENPLEREIQIDEVVTETRTERLRLRDINEQILRLKQDLLNCQNQIIDIKDQIAKLQAKKLQIREALGLIDANL